MTRTAHGSSGPGSWRRVALRVIRFELRAIFLTALAYGLVFAASPLTAPGTSAAAPRVVIIVGPAGRATDGYRSDGEQAAKVARAAGAEVTTIYSPDATWPTVKAALQGASIVVYMGHGNGFPSRYGTVLRKSTKNGLGLNPVAGVDDVAHQYFGESYLAKHVRLAPHAVVLLHHLCYASGNSEPGLPEGDLETAQQRVDNMAAGWLAAGAEAVLAEAYGDPAHYVGRVLAGRSTIERIWRTGPTAHDHVVAFPSVRTPGMTALMDPTRKSSGFYRSLVVRADMRADEVAEGAALVGRRTAPVAAESPASRIEPEVTSIRLQGLPVVGAELDLALVFKDPGSAAPAAVGVGVRWDPLVVDPPPGSAAASAPLVTPSAPPGPVGSPDPSTPTEDSTPPASTPTEASTAPASTPAASTSAADPVGEPTAIPEPSRSADAPAAPLLIVPETLGEVVSLADVKHGEGSVTATIVAPEAPGLYRLVTTVHDADGAALETRGDGRVPALLVRVTRPLSAFVETARQIDVIAGALVDLPVIVMNSGLVPWVGHGATPAGDERTDREQPGSQAVLIGHWVHLDRSDSRSQDRAVWASVDPMPGATDAVSLRFAAPGLPGEYLLVLDVMSGLDGSLAAAGVEPVVVRVTVAPPA